LPAPCHNPTGAGCGIIAGMEPWQIIAAWIIILTCYALDCYGSFLRWLYRMAVNCRQAHAQARERQITQHSVTVEMD
ncbi:MAG: hypothetical protein JOZ57_18845, partial [Abitibacteriaceae bacterium]|nr:hypothetical protein [Abditibacteriaceae bacterium]